MVVVVFVVVVFCCCFFLRKEMLCRVGFYLSDLRASPSQVKSPAVLGKTQLLGPAQV